MVGEGGQCLLVLNGHHMNIVILQHAQDALANGVGVRQLSLLLDLSSAYCLSDPLTASNFREVASPLSSTTVVIVQARLSSTRLPNKVLKTVGGRTVLEEVLLRCRSIPNVDLVCCATVEGEEGDAIEQVARSTGSITYRGDRDDVLGRYAGAAQATAAGVILRVTSDCPLIDPNVCAGVIELRERTAADYACNNLRQEWPYGLDCEAFSRSWLERANREATDPFEREHVTPWIRNHPDVQREHLEGPDADVAQHRWTLDYPEDLRMLRALFEELPPPPEGWDYRTVLSTLEEHPEIRSLNASRGARHIEEEG